MARLGSGQGYNGIITFIPGGMICFHWPSSSVWAIGILVGLTLLMTGMTRLMFALTARKLTRLAAQESAKSTPEKNT